MRVASSAAFIFAAAMLGMVAGCREQAGQAQGAAAPSADAKDSSRSITAVYPKAAHVGEPFQKQPNGNSAISVTGYGLTARDVIFWDGKPLKTVFGNPRWITAEIPSALLIAPKHVEIVVSDPANPASDRLRTDFEVLSPENTSR